jgi:hypothetical protein
MIFQSLLGTLSADWDLFAAPVWIFLGIGSAAAFLVSRFSPLSAVAQQRLLTWLPTLMLLGCLLTRWINCHWYSNRSYHAYLDGVFLVSLAFGVAFTIDLLRTRHGLCRVAGWIYVPAYIALLAAALWYIRVWQDRSNSAD